MILYIFYYCAGGGTGRRYVLEGVYFNVMGHRGTKPKGKVKIRWTPNFAYIIGLIATDGCLSKDGRHITLTSKDGEQLANFKKCLGLGNIVGNTMSGYNGKPYGRVQFGDVLFYKFLLKIGLTPAKSKTIGGLKIPTRYFFDFLRGSLDGDGCTYSYWDKRWKSSFMFYTCFVSASRDHILWLQENIKKQTGASGHISGDGRKATFHLKYAKKESSAILKKMYYSDNVICLKRKRLKIEKTLSIAGLKLS